MEDKTFKKLYSELGLIDENENMLSLQDCCPNCTDCWQNAQDRKPSHNWAVARPYIGKKYNELKLLIIGINMNNYGDYESAIDLIKWSREELEKGKIKALVGTKYRGTFLFHRMASYAVSIAEKEGLISPRWINTFPKAEDVGSVLDYIAYTNHIKCSPHGDKSKPTDQMWENCGSYILKKEIELLNPEKILVLGKSDNIGFLSQKVFDESVSLLWKENIGIGTGTLNGRKIDLTVVPHPAGRGGNKRKIMNDLNHLLHSSN